MVYIVVVQYIIIGLITNGILLNNLWGRGNGMEVIRFNWNETDTRNALTIYIRSNIFKKFHKSEWIYISLNIVYLLF